MSDQTVDLTGEGPAYEPYKADDVEELPVTSESASLVR